MITWAGGGGNLFSNCPASSFPDRQTLFREHFASCDPCYFKPWKRSRPTWNLCQDLKPSAASGQTSTYCTQYIFPPPEQHLYNREYDEHNIFGRELRVSRDIFTFRSDRISCLGPSVKSSCGARIPSELFGAAIRKSRDISGRGIKMLPRGHGFG